MLALTTLGALITVLGLFVAGNIVYVGVGLGSVFAGGLIAVAERIAGVVERRTSEVREVDPL